MQTNPFSSPRRPSDLVGTARRLPADERGVVLVMALGILFVLTIVFTTLMFMTSSNARNANTSKVDEQAFTLAEAGLENAASVLFKSSDPSLSSAVPSGSASLGGGT